MPQKIRQSFLGNIGAIEAEAGFVTLNSINKLQARLLEVEGSTSNFQTTITSEVAVASVLRVRKNSTNPDVGSKNRLNFIEGGNITLTLANDIADDEIDINIAVTSTGTATRNVFWTSTNLQSSDAANYWDNVNKRLSINAGTSPGARIHSIDTTEPLRLGYDASNYMSANVRADGSVVLDSTGTTPSIETGDEVPLGVNVTPTAWLHVQGAGADPAADVLALSPWGWWSADYITSGGSAGTPTNLDAGAGTAWYDRSLNSRTVTLDSDAGAGGGNCTFVASAQNSLPGIHMASASRGALGAAYTFNDLTIFMVVKPTSSGTGPGSRPRAFTASDASSFLDFPYVFIAANGISNWRFDFDDGGATSSDAIPEAIQTWTDTQFNVFSIKRATATFSPFINGTAWPTRATDDFGTALSGAFTNWRYFGSANQSTDAGDYVLLERIVWDRALSSGELTTVNTYLNNKYALNGGTSSTATTRDYAQFDNTDGDTLAFIDKTSAQVAFTDTDSSADTLAARLLLRQSDGHMLRLESNGTFNTDILLTTPTANRDITFHDDSGRVLAFTPTSLTSGDLVRYNGTTWVNATLAGAGVASSALVITAGDGLTGTHDLSSSFTIDVGAGTGITVNLDNVQISTIAAESFFMNNTASTAVPVAVAGSTVAGAGLTYTTGGILAVGVGTGIAVNANDVALAAIAGDSFFVNTSAGSAVPVAVSGSVVAGAGMFYGGGGVLNIATLVGGGLTIAANDIRITAGAANRVLGMDAAGTSSEYKDVLGTANEINITHAANSITIGIVDPLIAAKGGTGFASYAVGDVLYADTTSTLAKLADVATGNALISGGVTTAPSWGKIGLTTHVSGDLPYANLVQAQAASLLLGRGSTGIPPQDWQEITLGTGLTMTGTVLSATGSGGITGIAADSGGTTTGSTVTIAGNATTNTVRSTDTITVGVDLAANFTWTGEHFFDHDTPVNIFDDFGNVYHVIHGSQASETMLTFDAINKVTMKVDGTAFWEGTSGANRFSVPSQFVPGATTQFSDTLNIDDSVNIALGTSNGTMIGTADTQLLAFWGEAPVPQYNATAPGGFTANATANFVFAESTFDGGTGGAAYTIGDLVLALQLCGIIR